MRLKSAAWDVWRQVTEPSDSVVQTRARYQARATSSILILTLVLGLVLLLGRIAAGEYSLSLTAGLLIVGIAYLLSRMRFYRLAGLLAIGALGVLPFCATEISSITIDFLLLAQGLTILTVALTYILFSPLLSVLLALLIFVGFLVIPLPFVAEADDLNFILVFPLSVAGLFAVLLIVRQFDADQRRQTERDLKASEERYRVIVETQSDLICRWLPDTTLTFVNDAYCRYLGKPREALIGVQFASWVFPEDFDALQRHIAAITPENPTAVTEHRGVDPEGNVKWQQWTDTGLFDGQGNIVEFQAVGRDITERKLAEAALRASEERYRVIVEAQSELISRCLPDTTLTFVNDAYCRYAGKTREELIGTKFAKVLFPEDREATWHALASLTPENPIVTTEHRSVNPHKGVRWQQWTDQAFFDQAGRIIEYQSVGRDITSLKRAEEAEREQRQFAEALSSTAALISSTLNLDEVLDRILSQIVLINPAKSAEILLIENGVAHIVRVHSQDQQYAQDILNLRLPVQSTRNLREMAETSHTLTIPNVLEYEGWVDTNASHWVRALVGAPILLEGETIGFLIMSSNQESIFTETDAAHLQAFADQAAIAIRNARLYDEIRRYASGLEALVKERTTELELAQQRLRAILDGTGEGILYTEQERIQYTNVEFCKLTGYAQNELVRQPYTLLYVPELHQRQVEAARKSMGEKGIWRGEMQIRRKDGTIFDAGLTVAQVGNGGAEPLRAVTVLRDISHEKLLQAQRSNLVTYASHELRTPITNLKTRLYLLRRRPEALTEHLDILDAVTERMQHLVEDLLDISRLEHGLIPLRRDNLVLQDVINEVVSVQTAEAARRELDLHVTVTSEPIYVFADRERLIQVVTNLLTNALNYTPSGGQIEIMLQVEAGSAVAEVADTGIGIAPEDLPYIFQPFFRVVSEVNGTGLGLSIVKEIVEMHGGAIGVRSELGRGSVFQIKLPLLKPIEAGETTR